MQIRTESDNHIVKTFLNLADEWNEFEGKNMADSRVMGHAEDIIKQASYLLEHYPYELKGTAVFTKTYDFNRVDKNLTFPT